MSRDFSNEEVLVEVSHLKQYFTSGRASVKAVDDVSFQIHRGEVLGVVGESGCGKTTTGRSIIKLYDITGGKVFFNGECIQVGIPELKEQLKAAKKEKNQAEVERLKKEIAEGKQINKTHTSKDITKMQMIFQDPIASLDPRMTVREIISEGFAIRKIKDKDYIEKRVLEMLDLVGLLPEHADRYPHEFSGGQRQRICIARALAVKPEFIVCDEPVSALDVSIQAQIINLLMDLQEEYNLTYLFISHDLSVVEHISDDVAVMKLGEIVEMNTKEEIFNNPQCDYTKELLAAIPGKYQG